MGDGSGMDALSGRAVGARDLIGQDRQAVGGLIVFAMIVGVAIALDGPVSKGLNALGGIGWLISTIVILRSFLSAHRRIATGATIAAVVLILATAVRPFDLVAAIVGFGAAGALVATVAVDKRIVSAALVPAMWLPVHLVIAIARSIAGGADRVRTDPPPTAALVPLAMVLSAIAGAAAVEALYRRRRPVAIRTRPTESV